MDCYDCGNCRLRESVFFCTGRNNFVLKDIQPQVREKVKGNWKKGDPSYESRRRKIRQGSDCIKRTG